MAGIPSSLTVLLMCELTDLHLVSGLGSVLPAMLQREGFIEFCRISSHSSECVRPSWDIVAFLSDLAVTTQTWATSLVDPPRAMNKLPMNQLRVFG